MKKTLPLVIVLMLVSTLTIAQESSKAWSLGFGVNAVDVYPVNEDAPQGDYFDEFFNVNDHWNMGLYVDVSRNFTERLSLNVRGSYNQISKWGQTLNDPSIVVDNLDYIGLDGMINFKILKNTLIQPFVAVGGGYTWIEEGTFNTFSDKDGTDNLVGAGTVNGAFGLDFRLSDNVAIRAQSTYKHSFKDYLTKHFQHSVGLTYTFATAQEKKDKLDDDNDGVSNENDLCPQVAGLPEYAGCADTDGDGIPDSLDKCPNEKGTDNGCPVKVAQVIEEVVKTVPVAVVVPKEIATAIYFDYKSSTLDNNAKQLLDVMVSSFEEKSEINVSLDGYADSIGSDGYNKQISEARVQSILTYLVSKGVDKAAITTNSFGEANPVAPNTTKDGRALNRRAQLKVTLK
jgi:outer membrane protein OmpA-like peptidoglycan-associated protein